MGVVNVHEELKRAIDTLTDDQAAALLHVVRVMRPMVSSGDAMSAQSVIDAGRYTTWEEALARADELYRQLEREAGTFPDIAEMIDDMREERDSEILDSLR